MARPIKDISNNVYGSLTVLYRSNRQSLRREYYWMCRCGCGKEYEVRGTHLRTGAIKKCRACQGKLRRSTNPKSGYPAGFSLRLRRFIRFRDDHICQYCKNKCGMGELDVHHIDHNRNNNKKENLISLCNNCHYMCHHKDANMWITYWQNYMKERI
jgi:hypothetical protein